MIYQVTDILRDVRVALDRNATSDELEEVSDIDTLTDNEIVRSKIREAVRTVHNAAPIYLLEGGHHFGDELYWDDLCSGHILLPDDFMRLIVFEMSDWERPVYFAISTDDTQYDLQHSRFKGIRGTAQKPVCAIAVYPEGKALEFFSCKSEDATVSKAMYLPYPRIDESGGIEICERCYTAVVYAIASLVLSAYGEAQAAQVMTELSKNAME